MNGFEIEEFRSPDGAMNARIKKDGRTLTLHSVSPEKEAERMAAGLNPALEWVLVAGFGLGYLTEHLLKKTRHRILVFEHTGEILDFAAKHRKIESVLNNPRVFFFKGDISTLTGQLDSRSIRELNYVIHRPYFQLFPEVYSQLEGILTAYLSKKQINQATLKRFQKTWLKNIMRNSASYFSLPGLEVFDAQFEKKPAVIVGAGPSLGQTLPELKKNQDRFLILSTDTALPMLYANGINADIVVSVDPQDKNAYYLLYSPRKDAVLVADASASNLGLMKYNPGNAVLFDSIFPAYETLSAFWGEKGRLMSGGSVSTTAFDLARHLKCDPIVFIGQDLSFSKKHTHYRGNVLEEQFTHRTDRFNTYENYNSRTLIMSDRIEMTGINGAKVLTDRKFLTFLDWFKREIRATKARVINSTPEGVVMEGAEHISFGKVIEEIAGIANPDKRVRLIPVKKDPAPFLEMLKGVQKAIGRLKPLAVKAFQASRNIDSGKKGTKEYSNQLNIMNEFDRALVNAVKEQGVIARFIEFTMQESIENVLNDGNANGEELVRRWENFYREAFFGILQVERLISKRLVMK